MAFISDNSLFKENIGIFITMVIYMCLVVGIGVYFYKRSQKNSENYFLGGRTLGPWVAAMSAEASDMSGWLLMGLPGVAYWCGLADAFWTAIGLAIGTYVNWLIVAKRLRNYSQVAGNSITIPDFFSNRYKEDKKIILGIASVFILIFFTVYASSCFVTVGKLFNTLFGIDYHVMLIIGAIFVVAYTLLGGFLAESVSDFMQAIVMITALVIMVCVGLVKADGIGNVIENAKAIPGFFSLNEIANPVVVDGVQQGTTFPLFGEAKSYSVLNVVSMLAWGLGYFGVPQVLLRFMAIRKPSEIKSSRRIATVWVIISLGVAVFIGIVGRELMPISGDLNTASKAENILIVLSTEYLPVVVAGIIMAGILAATISSSDSYLLIASSAVSKNIYQGIIKKGKETNEKTIMWISRIVLIVIALVGIVIAWNEESVIFKLVSFAWAGFGATFGPIMLFSLFWKRTTRAGAIAGMVTGGVSVFIWKLVLNPFIGGIFAIYELLPAFILSSVAIVIASLATKKPSEDIEKEFELAKAGIDESEIVVAE
ncbi:MAG: sodium/proline symporter PutP [Clostridia bacterium]|nr:sodium/proline symporter PutP [Clostridia bacterium]